MWLHASSELLDLSIVISMQQMSKLLAEKQVVSSKLPNLFVLTYEYILRKEKSLKQNFVSHFSKQALKPNSCDVSK